jgi:hypothetical protein
VRPAQLGGYCLSFRRRRGVRDGGGRVYAPLPLFPIDGIGTLSRLTTFEFIAHSVDKGKRPSSFGIETHSELFAKARRARAATRARSVVALPGLAGGPHVGRRGETNDDPAHGYQTFEAPRTPAAETRPSTRRRTATTPSGCRARGCTRDRAGSCAWLPLLEPAGEPAGRDELQDEAARRYHDFPLPRTRLAPRRTTSLCIRRTPSSSFAMHPHPTSGR